jgi:hypothetical protein
MAIQRCHFGATKCSRIDPAESFYSQYFDDESLYKVGAQRIA